MRNKKSLQTRRHIDWTMPAVFRYRFLITLFVLLIGAGVFCGSVSADNPDVSNAQNLSDALNISVTGAAYANGDTVYLVRDVPLNYTINITAENSITLTIEDSDHTISRYVSDVPLFNVSSGTFILTGNSSSDLIIDGNMTTYGSANGTSLISVNGGELNMRAGSVLQNSSNTCTLGGGGVNVTNGGTFNMTGGNISNNTANNWGGGVLVFEGGMLNMTSGNIANNTASNGFGGGVLVFEGGVFNMNGGTISSNTADSGGGISVSGGTFNMNDGTISDNNADDVGGGVNVNGGMFNMTGGNIDNNIAIEGGGVDVTGGTFNMTGGNIDNNTVVSSGGGVGVDGSTFTMTGGNISSNNADYGGGGVIVVDGGMFIMNGGNISSNNADIVGSGIYQYYGNFTMTGFATVDSDNDVYLNSSSFVNVTGVLDSGAGSLNITPGFTNGTVISYNAGIPLGTWTENFALNQTWASEHPGLALGQSGSDILLGTNCTVNFSINDTTLYLSQYNVSGALLAQPADPTRSGYTFNGWNNTTNGVDTPWNFSTERVMVNPTNLSATWTQNVTQTSYYSGGTTGAGTSVTLVFRVNESTLEEKNLTSNDIAVLYYINGEWNRVMSTSIQLVDGVYLFTVITSDKTSPFMVAYNVDGTWVKLEEEGTPTPTPTTGPTEIVPTSTTTPIPTEPTSSPVPLVGIIAGLGAAVLLLRRK